MKTTEKITILEALNTELACAYNSGALTLEKAEDICRAAAALFPCRLHAGVAWGAAHAGDVLVLRRSLVVIVENGRFRDLVTWVYDVFEENGGSDNEKE